MSIRQGDPRTRESLLAKIETYEGQELCPRCGNGFPVCADGPITHDESCALYEFSYDVCGSCEKELGWDAETTAALRLEAGLP